MPSSFNAFRCLTTGSVRVGSEQGVRRMIWLLALFFPRHWRRRERQLRHARREGRRLEEEIGYWKEIGPQREEGGRRKIATKHAGKAWGIYKPVTRKQNVCGGVGGGGGREGRPKSKICDQNAVCWRVCDRKWVYQVLTPRGGHMWLHYQPAWPLVDRWSCARWRYDPFFCSRNNEVVGFADQPYLI